MPEFDLCHDRGSFGKLLALPIMRLIAMLPHKSARRLTRSSFGPAKMGTAISETKKLRRARDGESGGREIPTARA
jgi:hypothetical protein